MSLAAQSCYASQSKRLASLVNLAAAAHFFFPFDFPLGVEVDPLDATLPAREFCVVVDLLPVLTTSSCLF